MTFYGESAPLDWANPTVGAPFADYGDAIRYRAGTATVTAGDVFVAGFFDSVYLTSGDAATFAVAIVHTGGSATLRLSGGPDPEFDLDETDASAYSLGDHAVSGSGTLAVELPWVTVADYLDQAVETAVRVEVLSGSVTIQQVKLRIWPPGGAVGGWSDVYPGWSDGGYTLAVRMWQQITVIDSGDQDATSPEAAWDAADAAAVASFDGTTTTTYSTGLGEIGTQAHAQIIAIGGTPFIWQSKMWAIAEVEIYQGVDWRTAYPINGLVEGTDFIIPPDEVPDDSAYLVQQIGSGSVEWVNTSSTASLSAADLLGWSPTMHSEGRDDLTVTPITSTASTVTGAGYTQGGPVAAHSGSPSTAPVTLNDDGSQFIVVSRGYAYDGSDWPGWYPPIATSSEEASVDWSLSFPGIASRAVLPPYRVWSPTVAPVNFMRVMQRGDGRGMGAGRVFNQGTRQGSSKVFGTY